jgi:hypothetical protein
LPESRLSGREEKNEKKFGPETETAERKIFREPEVEKSLGAKVHITLTGSFTEPHHDVDEFGRTLFFPCFYSSAIGGTEDGQ